jgi:small subunit ribosomal protein S20
MRQDAKRRDRNKAVKKALKVQLKKFEAALVKGSAEEKQAEFIAATKKLDKAAARKVIHANAAARKKSQLARKLNPKPAAPAAAK